MPRTHRITRALLLALVLAACEGASARLRFFARTDWRAPLACPPLPALGGLGTVADVSSISDSTFAFLLADERALFTVDARLRLADSLRFDRDGPRGALRPVSALVTDTMIFLADDARSSIRFFGRDGRDRGTVRLDFIPRRLRLVGGRLIVTPLVAGGSPAHLAWEIRGRQAVALGGPIARYDDIGINTLANMTSLAAFADRIVVMHEMVVPFGYVMRPGQPADSVRRFGVPVSADLQDLLGRVPNEPLTDRNVNQLAVVAFAAASDPVSRTVFYVTRTAVRGGRFQKLIVGLDSLWNVRDVFPVQVNPQHMIYLPARRSLIVVDTEANWFECKIS